MDAFPNIRTLLPHAGPSILLDSVVSFGPEGTVCRALLTSEHPYLSGGSVHSLLAIELFAQAAAVHRSLSQPDEGSEVPNGSLAAANLTLEVARLPAPSTLLVRVTPEATLGRLLRFSGELFLEGERGARVATGEVSVAAGSSAAAQWERDA